MSAQGNTSYEPDSHKPEPKAPGHPYWDDTEKWQTLIHPVEFELEWTIDPNGVYIAKKWSIALDLLLEVHRSKTLYAEAWFWSVNRNSVPLLGITQIHGYQPTLAGAKINAEHVARSFFNFG